MKVELSVVILCYRSKEKVYGFVDEVIKLLEELNVCWEIILVGNYTIGYDDSTPIIVKDIASKCRNIVAVTDVKEGMMGWDARSGMKRASGKYVCLIDGDGQMPAVDIIRVYEKIKQDDLDFVSPYRIKRYDSFIRSANSYIYNTIFKLLFPGISLKDVNAKPKIMKRDVYDKMQLRSDDWFLDAEIVIRCRRLKLRVGQIPTSFYKCSYRKSFVRFNTIFEFIKNLIIFRISDTFS